MARVAEYNLNLSGLRLDETQPSSREGTPMESMDGEEIMQKYEDASCMKVEYLPNLAEKYNFWSRTSP